MNMYLLELGSKWIQAVLWDQNDVSFIFDCCKKYGFFSYSSSHHEHNIIMLITIIIIIIIKNTHLVDPFPFLPFQTPQLYAFLLAHQLHGTG